MNSEAHKQWLLRNFHRSGTFDEARCYYIELCEIIPKNERIELLFYLESLVDNVKECFYYIDFWERLNCKPIELLNYIRKCPYKDDIKILRKWISLERNYGSKQVAYELAKKMSSTEAADLTIKAAILNDFDRTDEARSAIEEALNTKITHYAMKAYARTIYKITKDDSDAIRLCIPNLAGYICGESDDLNTDFKRLLKLVIKFEDMIGNKSHVEATKKILNRFVVLGG